MGFRLRILEGKSAGREFAFNQESVCIGRSPDNDLVLYDMGVSRHHCELLADGDTYTLRDTGSANGTLLNDVITTEAHIGGGDRVQIGPVVLEFDAGRPDDAISPTSQRREEMFRPVSDTQRRSVEEGNTVAVRSSSLVPAVRSRARAAGAPARPGSQGEGTASKPAAAESSSHTETGSFASYKQRRRLSQVFKGMPRSTRIALGVSAAILLVAVLLSVSMVVNRPEIDHSTEILLPDPTRSYGYGKVHVNTPDRVNFQFDYRGGRVIVLFTAGGIDTPTELEVLVNGKSVGFVEPTPGGWTSGLRVRLPRGVLKSGVNVLTFDNTSTPARPERWGVAQVRITEQPLPVQDEGRARELHKLGMAAFDARSVAPPNLWRAIQYFEEAQASVEGMSPTPSLFITARQAEEQARAELQRIYNEAVFAAEKELRFGDRQAAAQTLRNLLRFFPDQENPRHQQAKARLREIAGADVAFD